jgi:CheY-like chemotaxis protein
MKLKWKPLLRAPVRGPQGGESAPVEQAGATPEPPTRATRARGRTPRRPAGAGALRVLLADDNRDFTDSLTLILQGAGHRVRVAYDGPSALNLARAEAVDAGLFDIGMPGLDGYSLAASVRTQSPGRGCLLVAITGWGRQADRECAQSAGFDRHLVKPVDVDLLLRLLADHAAQRSRCL